VLVPEGLVLVEQVAVRGLVAAFGRGHLAQFRLRPAGDGVVEDGRLGWIVEGAVSAACVEPVLTPSSQQVSSFPLARHY
jgi:hypothetical protein